MILPPNQASHSLCVPSLAASERHTPLWLSFFQLLNLSNPSLVVWRFHTKKPLNFQLYTRPRAQVAPLQIHPCVARQSRSTPVLRNLALTAPGQRLKRPRVAQIHMAAHEDIMPRRHRLQHAQRELVREARLCAHHDATSPITTLNHRWNPLPRNGPVATPIIRAPLSPQPRRGPRLHLRSNVKPSSFAHCSSLRRSCTRRRRGGVLACCGRRRRTSARAGEARSESRTAVVGVRVAATMTLLLVAVVLASRLRRGA